MIKGIEMRIRGGFILRVSALLLLAFAQPCFGEDIPVGQRGKAAAESFKSRREFMEMMEKRAQERMNEKKAERDAMYSDIESRSVAAQKESVNLQAATPQDLAMKNLSRLSVLGFNPPDVVVEEGASCSTELVLFSQTQGFFDSVDIVLSFKPDFLIPVSVHDDALRPLIDGHPEFKQDLANGVLSYRAKLASPQPFFQQRLLTVVWKARRAVDYAVVEFSVDKTRSSILLGEQNILADDLFPEGAMIPFGACILPKDWSARQGFVLPAGGAAASFPAFTKGPIWLEMESSQYTYAPGEEFDIRIYMRNPEKTLFDTVALLIEYPQEAVEILDWDKGNWIRAGVNIHDAPAHEAFPFDFHIANEVDAKRGEIYYRMGVSNVQAMSEGLIGEIKVRALDTIRVDEFQFAFNSKGDPRTTEVKFMDQQLLVPPPAPKGQVIIEVPAAGE